MCKDKISKATDIQQDLTYLAGKWRDSVVQEVGRERYDALSEQLGGDLAYAYMDYRVEQLMIDKLVKERMPKNSADYIIRKAAQSSLLGLSQTLSRSPLAEEIEARGEAAYRPSKLEKGAGHVLGASADAVMMGGVGSWASLAKFIGADVARFRKIKQKRQQALPYTQECESQSLCTPETNGRPNHIRHTLSCLSADDYRHWHIR